MTTKQAAKPLTATQKVAMMRVRNGADVSDYFLAKQIRGIERDHPTYISIGKTRARKYGVHESLPYFGAILTPAGVAALRSK